MATTLYNSTVSTSAYSSSSDAVISNAYTFRLEVIENSTTTADNDSSITTNVYIKAKSSAWNFNYGSDSIKAIVKRTSPSGLESTIIDAVYKKHTGTSSEVRIATFTEGVPHLADGTGTVSYQFNWDGASAGKVSSGLPKSCSLSSGVLTLTPIPRKVSVTATPSSVGLGDTLNVSVPDSGLYTTVTIKLGSVTKTIWANEYGAKSASISYNDLRSTSYFGPNAYGSMTITCESTATSGGASLGTTSITVSLLDSSAGGTTVPISLYHKADGTGVSIGYEATGPGFYVNGSGPFMLRTINVDGVEYKVLAL